MLVIRPTNQSHNLIPKEQLCNLDPPQLPPLKLALQGIGHEHFEAIARPQRNATTVLVEADSLERLRHFKVKVGDRVVRLIVLAIAVMGTCISRLVANRLHVICERASTPFVVW